MSSFEHKSLVEKYRSLSESPLKEAAFANWINAEKHLESLVEDSSGDEITVFSGGGGIFLTAAVVSEARMELLDKDDLLNWNSLHPSVRTAYVWDDRKEDDVQIESVQHDWGTNCLKGAQPLVFFRSGDNLASWEILQEYLHLTGTFWHEAEDAYCLYNRHNGNLESAISVTQQAVGRSSTLVSFRREYLDQYLVASDSVLVRMFDIYLHAPDRLPDWTEGPETLGCKKEYSLFYRQQIDQKRGSWTRGFQIVRPSRPKSELYAAIRGDVEEKYVEFITWDWRNNNKNAIISTEPKSTTNYVQASSNSLPFEISPAFFDPKVLELFQNNRENYKVNSRLITCHNAWSLRFHINKARQVHVYIRDLRQLPYSQQQYWFSFNVKAKAGISKRAVEEDFQGKWDSTTNTLEALLSILREWKESDCPWWTLDDDELLTGVHIPLTDNQDTWSRSFWELSKLVVEGFVSAEVLSKVQEKNISYKEPNKSQTIYLLKLLTASHSQSSTTQVLEGISTVQLIRSKVYAHRSGKKAKKIVNQVLSQHQTFTDHFESICGCVEEDLRLIEQAMKPSNAS